MFDLTAGLIVMAVVVIAIGGALWHAHRNRMAREALARLCERDGLQTTIEPCGLPAHTMRGRFHATPSGDRHSGLRFAVHGPARVPLGGGTASEPTALYVGAFEWWYEQKVRQKDRDSYRTVRTIVAVARLPVEVPGRITVRPEPLLGRLGLRRRDQQLESEEFNRRFRVQGSDPRLTLRLLDASMQHRMLEHGVGRTLHLERDVLVFGGRPNHADPAFPGVIGQLPAVLQDLTGLLRHMPAGLWRAATPVEPAEATEPAEPPPGPAPDPGAPGALPLPPPLGFPTSPPPGAPPPSPSDRYPS